MLSRYLPFALLAFTASLSHAATLANFEGGSFGSWTLTGNAWSVGGSTGTSPNISPAEGNFFARSGAPNASSGPLAESNAGTATSPAFTVTGSTLTWLTAGWSGATYNGLNYFYILDQSLNVVWALGAPQTDAWVTHTVDLYGAGLSNGDTFYFGAVDQIANNAYGWLAFDNLEISETAAVPEPSSCLLVLGGVALVVSRMKRRSAA